MTTRAELEALVREADAMYLAETREPEQAAMIRRLSVVVRELLTRTEILQDDLEAAGAIILKLREKREQYRHERDAARQGVDITPSVQAAISQFIQSTAPSESERTDPAS